VCPGADRRIPALYGGVEITMWATVMRTFEGYSLGLVPVSTRSPSN
jgi:hypothetical protein